MHPDQLDLPHTDRLFVPLHTSLLEKWDLQMISVLNLKLQNMTVESLIAAWAQRMNRNKVEHILTCWRKQRQKITFLTHQETFSTLIKVAYRYTGCHRRNGPNFGRVFLMLNYTDITQNTYVQSWTFTEIMAREVWNFDSCYTLTDCQIHIETGRNMWFL